MRIFKLCDCNKWTMMNITTKLQSSVVLCRAFLPTIWPTEHTLNGIKLTLVPSCIHRSGDITVEFIQVHGHITVTHRQITPLSDLLDKN